MWIHSQLKVLKVWILVQKSSFTGAVDGIFKGKLFSSWWKSVQVKQNWIKLVPRVEQCICLKWTFSVVSYRNLSVEVSFDLSKSIVYNCNSSDEIQPIQESKCHCMLKAVKWCLVNRTAYTTHLYMVVQFWLLVYGLPQLAVQQRRPTELLLVQKDIWSFLKSSLKSKWVQFIFYHFCIVLKNNKSSLGFQELSIRALAKILTFSVWAL